MRRDSMWHGLHGMHGLMAGTAATMLLAATFVHGAGAVEPPTIPTAAAGVAALRCTVGQPCTFAAPVFVCDYAGAEKIAAAGPAKGGEVGAGLVRDTTCRTVPAGRPLGTEATKSALIVYLTEGGQHLGYTPVGVFAPGGFEAQTVCDRPGGCATPPAASPVLRDTARLSDIVISEDRGPDSSAIDLRGQGTRAATGVFRSGPRERRKFCEGYWEKDQTDSLKSCLSEPDATITVKANCEAQEVSFNGRRYGLFERPRDAAPDIHLDEHRRMLYRDLKSGEWLDGSTRSGEVTVRTALNALCPGVDPAAAYGLVYRKVETVGKANLAEPLAANEPADTVERGACLELKVDGIGRPCNNDMRLNDDGKGTVDLITGFLGPNGPKKTVLNFVTAQRSDMENSYGYALRITAVRTMTFDEPASRMTYSANGLCFMVKPNPVRAGSRAVKQDIVIMCTATVLDAGSSVKKVDWKFVY